MTMKQTIHDTNGQRLYVSPPERVRFLSAASKLPPLQHAFCVTLVLTGCRISEALNLTFNRIDYDQRVIIIESLKKRRKGHFRSIPVPEDFFRIIKSLPGHIRYISQNPQNPERIWSWGRTTGYTIIKDTMMAAGVQGAHASPKGLRHGFAIHALSKGIPLNMIQKWLGHSSIEITSIYLQATGDEEYRLAELMWTT